MPHKNIPNNFSLTPTDFHNFIKRPHRKGVKIISLPALADESVPGHIMTHKPVVPDGPERKEGLSFYIS